MQQFSHLNTRVIEIVNLVLFCQLSSLFVSEPTYMTSRNNKKLLGIALKFTYFLVRCLVLLDLLLDFHWFLLNLCLKKNLKNLCSLYLGCGFKPSTVCTNIFQLYVTKLSNTYHPPKKSSKKKRSHAEQKLM